MDQFDAYIVHASEDAELASKLAEGLKNRGLRVWFNSFTPGLRLRQQMEVGLSRSTFGVVVVSESLFDKKWAVEELDALMGLEDGTSTRIIPVWWQQNAAQVRARSPMLSMRSAVVISTLSDLARAQTELVSAIVQLSSERGFGHWIRAQVLLGLAWIAGPAFAASSFDRIDSLPADGYGFATFSRFPDPPSPNSAGVVRPVADFLLNPASWDGVEITLIGRQLAGTLQVLDEHGGIGEHDGSPVTLAGYVFQLRSVDLADYQTTYVYMRGPHGPGLRPDMPEDWVVWVTGVLVAYGSVRTLAGPGANCIYVVARSVYGHPPVE